MEKKKLLLVAVSVGVVLLILIGIPLMILSPRQSTAPSWQTAMPAVIVPQPAVEAPVLTQASDTDQQLNAGNDQQDGMPQIPAEIPQVTTITVPAPHTVAVPDTPVRVTPRPETARPAPARPAAVPSAPKETPRPQVTARPQTDSSRAYNNYWVQTGAFSTKIRAEGAKESLEAKGITSIIENSDVNGKTWYRVRVGPYMSENEASYWLALVKAIDGFGESQIRQTRAVQ